MEIELKKLGDITTGNTPSKKDEHYWNSADICFVKPDSIADEGITLINDSSEYISENARNKARVVSKDAIFVTCIGSIGKIGIADYGDYAFNQQINVIEPNEIVLPRYLAYNLLYSKPRLAAIANAPVVPIINKTQFGDFIVSIEEDKIKQAEIVSVLDKLTGIIESRNKELAELDILIKARFVEMFGENLDSGKPLSDLAEITGGLTKNSKRNTFTTKMPYLRVANVFFNHLDLDEVLVIGVQENEIKKTLLKDGDVLFVEGNGSVEQIGRVAIWDGSIEPCLHQNHLIKARFDKEMINPIYALFYFMSQKGRAQIIRKAVSTSGLHTLSVKKIEALELPVQPIELQNQFADFVHQVDKSKVVVQKALDETQTLFDSLMQEYFG